MLLEAFSSSMVSYLKLFLEFLMLRRLFVSATLNNKIACKPGVHASQSRCKSIIHAKLAFKG